MLAICSLNLSGRGVGRHPEHLVGIQWITIHGAFGTVICVWARGQLTVDCSKQSTRTHFSAFLTIPYTPRLGLEPGQSSIWGKSENHSRHSGESRNPGRCRRRRFPLLNGGNVRRTQRGREPQTLANKPTLISTVSKHPTLSRIPRARTTRRTVANDGFPSLDRALYRPSLLMPTSRLNCAMFLRPSYVVERSPDQRTIARILFEARLEIEAHVFLGP